MPEEIDDEEHDEVAERVAAIDVAKAAGMVCIRVPHEKVPGRRRTKVWQVAATTNAIMTLADELAGLGIERVVVESTSDYWRPFVYLLEARGLNVWLVNAQSVKQVPGRPKTDKLDAVWLAKLNERGMLRPSFIPPIEIRQLRDYTRLRIDLTHDRNRQKERIEKLLEDALIKLSSVAADIFGVSGRAMMEALIAGERDPQAPRGAGQGADAGQATGAPGGADRPLRRVPCRAASDTARPGRRPDREDRGVERSHRGPDRSHPRRAAAFRPPARSPRPSEDRAPLPAVDRLDEVTGIGRSAAQTIIAEVGLNMTQFATAGHLVSWAKLSPRTVQSGAKSRSASTGLGNPYLKGVLGEAAIAAARTDTFLGERYRRLAKRMGKLKALVAVARSILVIVWHLLANPNARFRDLGADFYVTRVNNDRKVRNLVHQLEVLLGHKVALDPAA